MPTPTISLGMINPFSRSELDEAIASLTRLRDVLPNDDTPPAAPSVPVKNWLPVLDVGATEDIVLDWLKRVKHHPRLGNFYWPTTMYMIDHSGLASREAVLWMYPSEVVTGKLHKFTVPFTTCWKNATGEKEIPEKHWPVRPFYPVPGLKVRAAAFEIQPQIMSVIKTIADEAWEIDLLV